MLWLAPQVFGQPQDINFTYLSSRDGLSSNTIYAILKDHYGLMWFATADGLNKFDGTNFTVYRHKPEDTASLQGNEILTLHEDKSGNLWVGTNGAGLSLYNRKNDAFTNFPTTTGPSSQISQYIRSICSDYEGKVWIAQYGGLSILDPKTQNIFNFVTDTSRPGALSTQIVTSVYEDSRRRMWVGTNAGLFLYNRETRSFYHYLSAESDSSSLSSNSIKAIAEDKKGNLWVGTTNGLSMLRPDGRGFINFRHHAGDPKSLSSNTIYSIAVDHDDKLWLATEDGLNILNRKTGEVDRLGPDYRNSHSLTGRSVRYVYIDNQGIRWLGFFQGGINKYDPNLNLFHLKQSNPFDPNGLNAPVVTSFAEDKNGNVFVGTDGGGLSLFNRQTGLFRHFNIQPKGNGNSSTLPVLALKMSRRNLLYIGTYSNGLFIMDPASGGYRQMVKGTKPEDINSNDLFCVQEDSRGNIWVGTNGEGINVIGADNKVLVKFSPNPKTAGERQLPVNGYIRAIEEDKGGNIWIGSLGSGLAVFHPQTGTFTIYDKSNSKLPGNAVNSILVDSRGHIWVGTFGGGLSLLDNKTGLFTTFSEKEGLQNDAIYHIVEDKTGLIWVSTNTGISSFDPKTKRFNNYTAHNGLQNNNFVHGAGLVLSSGELFFGGLEGFNYFDPRRLITAQNPSPVLLTDLRISNKSVVPSADGPIKEDISIAREINLDYKQNFALDFVALNYTTPEQNQYAYKLERFDRDWNYVGTAKTATYTNLDPGDYVFRVRTKNVYGAWNATETSIKIHVHPPFWRTIYAFIIYLLAITAILLYIRRKGIEKLKMNFALEQERLRAEQMVEQERKEAERVRELDQLKIKFLTNLSHEFRTPISLIMGPVDLLLSREKNEKSSTQLQLVRRNARRLLNLVNQLLDFRKMEEHELRLHAREGEFISFAKEVTESFRDLAERKKIDFSFESRIDRLYTCFDADKIERILFNLLSNAFKFTLEGGKIGIEINRLKKTDDPSKAWLSLKVIDTGIGIAEEKKEKVFELFFQSPTAPSVLNQGTGIGLSITKEFVKLHGGTITVDSKPGKGTTFTIELPFTPVTVPQHQEPLLSDASVRKPEPEYSIDQPEEPKNEPEPVGEEKAADKRKDSLGMPSILLIEDNEDFRFYLKENLRSHYRVYEASNGKEGWQKVLAHHPELIVSDINMPYMDGIALCKKIRSDKRTSHIPVILLTALAGEESQLKGLETGASDYITKPFNFEILNAKVKNLLDLNNLLKNTYTRQIKVLTPEVEMESDDAKFLQKVMLYLEENLTNSQLSVEDLSRHMGMSRSSLYHKLLELTGQSPVEYIRSVKLDKAAILLEKSDMNIAQVSYSVGFATPKYFAKSFKEKFNMLPSEYIAVKRKGAEIQGEPE